MTEWGERLSDLIDYLRRLTPDCDLAEFNQAAIDRVIERVRAARQPGRTPPGERPGFRSPTPGT